MHKITKKRPAAHTFLNGEAYVYIYKTFLIDILMMTVIMMISQIHL